MNPFLFSNSVSKRFATVVTGNANALVKNASTEAVWNVLQWVSVCFFLAATKTFWPIVLNSRIFCVCRLSVSVLCSLIEHNPMFKWIWMKNNSVMYPWQRHTMFSICDHWKWSRARVEFCHHVQQHQSTIFYMSTCVFVAPKIPLSRYLISGSHSHSVIV